MNFLRTVQSGENAKDFLHVAKICHKPTLLDIFICEVRSGGISPQSLLLKRLGGRKTA
jgi:hypothetical protein